MKVSILIATRNRAPFLQETLAAIRPAIVPAGMEAELLVIDNVSTDATAEVVKSARLDHIALRYLRENRPGKCHAINRGLRESDGDMILFIDDDVRPPSDWIGRMCQTLIEHGPCAVAGGVKLAPHLERSWMTGLHRSWLANTDWLDHRKPRGMVGANMGFSREVLRRVPAFDTELGPGALGFGDEQLFASQLLEAGYRIIGRPDVCVEHHFEPQRLLRGAWLSAARKRGRAQAYRGHHWEHWSSRLTSLRHLAVQTRLFFWRHLQLRPPPAEGCSETELKLEYGCSLLRAHATERRRPRNYAYHGLIKRRLGADPFEGIDASPVPASE